jgi:LysR family transcriptional regulator, flagellar master operon regulator
VDTELLKTFLEVCKTRHFGQAAENLYLTQAAVSSRIRQLEIRLGVGLFSRQRNNIKLTTAGERLLPHAQSVLSAWLKAYQEVAVSGLELEQFALAGSPDLWDILLHANLPRIKEVYPQLILRAEMHSQPQMPRQLLEHSIDLALLCDAPKVEELVADKLLELPLVMVSSHPLQELPGLSELGYIAVDWGHAVRSQCNELLAGIVPVLQTNMARVALQQILQARGAAYLPMAMVADLVAEGRLYIVPQAPKLNRNVFVCYRRDTDKKVWIEKIVGVLKGN